MKKGFIIIAVVLLITLYVMNKINTAKQLEFTVGVPKQISLRSGSLTFLLPLTARNITSGSVNIKAADFDVRSAGVFLGKALITNPTTILPNSNTVLNVSVTISGFDVLTAAGSIANLFKSGKINIELDGLIYAEGVQLPLNQSFTFDYKSVL